MPVRSTTIGFAPRRLRKYAIEAPMTPPPQMTTRITALALGSSRGASSAVQPGILHAPQIVRAVDADGDAFHLPLGAGHRARPHAHRPAPLFRHTPPHPP